MSIEQQITSRLQDELNPDYLEVHNESHQHNVPPNSETHFKVVVVSEEFAGLRRVARHQRIYKLLAEQLAGPVHALAIHTYSGAEWKEQMQAPDSPECMGGSKKDTV
jgi:BolA family transcriptional regulator, general stress-responsive regulator